MIERRDMDPHSFVSKLRVSEVRRQGLSTARDRDIAKQTAAKANAQMTAAKNGSTQSDAEARVRLLADLTKAEAEVKMRREELVPIHSEKSRRPMAGLHGARRNPKLKGLDPLYPVMRQKQGNFRNFFRSS